MRTGRLILINVVIVLVLVAVAGYGYWSWYQGYYFVSSSDAQVVAPLLSVSTPVPGTVSRMEVQIGQSVSAGQTLATVTASGGKTPTAITAPASGQVASISSPAGSTVTPGMPVLSLVQNGQVYIVANIPETRIRNVALGQAADVHIDAHPDTAFTGAVRAIQPATQSTFSLIPSAPTAGSFTKVTQRIPIYIRLDSTLGRPLADGMSAEVRIHIH